MDRKADVRVACIVVIALVAGVGVLGLVVKAINTLGAGTAPPGALDFVDSLTAIGAAIATVFVGVAAWRTSKRAAEIAAEALRTENARDAIAYEASLNAAIIRVFESMGEYVREMHDWLQTAGRIEDKAPPSINPDELPYPNEPSNINVAFRLDAAGLIARGDDQHVLRLISTFVATVELLPLHARPTRLQSLSRRIRAWRDGSQSREAIVAYLRQRVNEMRNEMAARNGGATV